MKTSQSFSFDFWSKLILLAFAALQIIRWPLFPQFMDIYYHLHTAWGFLQSGGYSTWDFWQFAPAGRPHLYPPLFHLLLALFLKIGIPPAILAKSLEMALPVIFTGGLWRFIRRNFSASLALFTLVTLATNFSFYLSLINHLPATLALIFGLQAMGNLLNNRIRCSGLWLALAFYTHTQAAFFFALAILFFGLREEKCRQSCAAVFLTALLVALPLLWLQVSRATGLRIASLQENRICEFKIIEYFLAGWGAWFCLKQKGSHSLFLGLLAASVIFLLRPFRFYSGEGYLPIILLSAVALDQIYTGAKWRMRFAAIAAALFLIIFSPTLLRTEMEEKEFKLYTFDSALTGMLLPGHNPRLSATSLWFPKEYLSAVKIIRENSSSRDIIYCHLANVNVGLAAFAGRASVNGLFPEVLPVFRFDPLAHCRIWVALIDEPQQIRAQSYGFKKVGENKIFVLYVNPSNQVEMPTHQAEVSWALVLISAGFFILLFWQAKRMDGTIRCSLTAKR